jgi:hypothetical protein
MHRRSTIYIVAHIPIAANFRHGARVVFSYGVCRSCTIVYISRVCVVTGAALVHVRALRMPTALDGVHTIYNQVAVADVITELRRRRRRRRGAASTTARQTRAAANIAAAAAGTAAAAADASLSRQRPSADAVRHAHHVSAALAQVTRHVHHAGGAIKRACSRR